MDPGKKVEKMLLAVFRIFGQVSMKTRAVLRRNGKFLKLLTVAILVPGFAGVLLFAMSWRFQDLPFFENGLEAGDDIAMKLQADTIEIPDTVRTMTFIDYNDEAMEMLNYPALIPPQSLADILDKVATARPRLIIVDIDVTWSDDKLGLVRLRNSLQQLNLLHIPTLLLRETSLSGTESRVLRPSALDAMVDAMPYVWWVSAEGMPSDDAVNRKMRVWITACLNRLPISLPSPQLAATFIDASLASESAKADFNQQMAEANESCDENHVDGRAAMTLKTRHKAISFNIKDAERIRYTMTWERLSQVRYNPAKEYWWGGGPDVSGMRQGIVLIGSSAGNRRDTASTPIGEMPGTLVVANSVRAWYQFGIPRGRSFWAGLLMMCGVCSLSGMIAAVFFRFVPPNKHDVMDIFLPVILAAMLWLAMVVMADPALAFSLFLVQYLSIMFTSFAFKHAERMS